MVAMSGEAVACLSMVADAGHRPHVVQRPDNRLAGIQNLLQVVQRQHPLVHPVQMDDIGLLEFRQRGDVGPRVGNIYGKQALLVEVVGPPDDDPFPHKIPDVPPRLAQGDHRHIVRLFVPDQHFCLDAALLQGFHQASSGDGCSSCLFRCIDDEYSHGSFGL